TLVTDDAVIKNLESEIQIAQKDYELMPAKFQKESLNFKDTYEPIKILEHARVPEKAESKMKMVLSAFAGVVGGILSTVMIFLMAFFDTSLNSPNKFHKFAGINLMGTLNKVKTQDLDLKYLFSSNGQNKQLDTFKESLRNLRYAIENSEGNKFLFTSTKQQEGKTFLIVTLAHAMTIKDKKILIVDTNFKNNTLTQMSKKTMQENLLNSRLLGENNLDSEFISNSINSQFNLDNVDIIGNKGTYQSPSEVFAGKDFTKFLEGLSNHYDYIFFEGAPLNNYSDTKELVQYVDKVIAVFAAESDIRQTDRQSINYLRQLGHKFLGGILNKMDLKDLN
ncbi:MAG: CpsD/CapB family tyrosine-protein kinase, partial [Bacteroidota bacterium]